MFYQSMPLYLRLTELLQVEYRLVANFPKQYKYSLGQDMIAMTWKMLDLFITAQTYPATKKQEKLENIQLINQQHDCLNLRIRFCGELKLISLKQQSRLNESSTEIGNMIGSWLKHV